MVFNYILVFIISAWISSGLTNLIQRIITYYNEGKFISPYRVLIAIPIYIILGPITLKFKK